MGGSGSEVSTSRSFDFDFLWISTFGRDGLEDEGARLTVGDRGDGRSSNVSDTAVSERGLAG